MLTPVGSESESAWRTWLLCALLAGAALRVVALPLRGTGDVTVWKVWSFAGAHDVTGMYGVGGSPPERRVLHWNGEAMTVDYPPVTLYALAAVGHAYQWFDPLFRDTAALSVFIKLPGVLLEIALLALALTWGRRRYGARAAMWTCGALWLNPALLLDGPVLGYLDPLIFLPLVVAVVAAWGGAAWLAGACAAVAVLTKPQAVFVIPVIVALVARRGGGDRWRSAASFVVAGAVTAMIVLLPYVLRGAWWNLVQALSRLASHDMLSAQAANIWWIATWIIRAVDGLPEWGWSGALTQEVRILGISAAMVAGYPNARIIGVLLVGLALLFAMWRTVRVGSLADAAALAAWSAYAYAMLGAQVHENHLVPAVPLMAVAAGLDRRFRPVFWSMSAIAALNLYLFYGLAPEYPPLVPRRITVVDVTVLLSIVNVGVFIWFTRRLRSARAVAEAPR